MMSERNFTIFDQVITAATAATVVPYGDIPESSTGITFQAKFTYGSGGTTAKAYLQTSVDNGTNWVDVACVAFTTASLTKIGNLNNTSITSFIAGTDGTLADNTAQNGFIGTMLRVKYVTTGTYGGSTSLKIDIRLHSA